MTFSQQKYILKNTELWGYHVIQLWHFAKNKNNSFGFKKYGVYKNL